MPAAKRVKKLDPRVEAAVGESIRKNKDLLDRLARK